MICKVCNSEKNEIFLNDIFNLNEHHMCYECFSKLKVINYKTIISNYECLSLYEYEGLIKEIIYAYKGMGDYELKDVFLEYFKTYIEIKYASYTIVFAPSFEEDDKRRGFNHVEGIFDSISLKKVKLFKKTENYKQSDHSFKERVNIKDYLKLNKVDVKLNKVLIVDDVLTSGNTLLSLAKLVESLGVKKIRMLTISKRMEASNK